MAGSNVIGVGAGVVILIIVWCITGLAWLQLSHKQTGLRFGITVFTLLTTAILMIIPTEDSVTFKQDGVPIDPDKISPEHEFAIFDYNFIWKAILIVLMLLNVVVGMGVYFTQFWSVRIQGPPLPVISPPVPASLLEKQLQKVEEENADASDE